MIDMPDLERQGFVHLYTGDGKGKTTAAAGLAVRALGAGKTVLFCQFLKGRESGELAGLKKLGAELLRAGCGEKFMFQMNEAELEEFRRGHSLCFDEAARRIMSGGVDMAVLDEVIDAVNAGLVPDDGLMGLIAGRPAKVELILTGRDPGGAIAGLSDYHTEFRALKHPYRRGILARRGIEY